MDKLDPVRREIKYSLLRNEKEQLPVIPVLVGIPDLTSLWVPEDFKGLKTLNYHVVSKIPSPTELNALVENIGKLPVGSTNSTQPPNVLDQDVHIHARVNLWGGLRHPYPLPADSFAFIEKEGNKWSLEIQSESSPRFNLNRYSIPTDILSDRPIEEVAGLIMEWYEIPRSRWCIKRENKKKAMMKRLFAKEEEVKWEEYQGNAAYSILHFLILDFYMLHVKDQDIGRCDVLYPSSTSISGSYDVLGHFADQENRLFGEYVCSLTTNLGGVDVDSKKLLYFPTVPGTALQCVDVYKQPKLDGVTYCGHVGLDRKGFHIYFVA